MSIPISILDNNKNCIYNFKSIQTCQVELRRLYNIKLTRDGIKNACKTHESYKGFNFRFTNDTVQN